MWCTVYILYENGRRLPAEKAKINFLHGWLRMHSKTPGIGMPFCQAFILPSVDAHHHCQITQLDHCRLSVINNGGMRLVGIEPHSLSDPSIRQSWWIVPSRGGS